MDRLLWRLEDISSLPHAPERLADRLRFSPSREGRNNAL
jgi:hypothetical protein